MFRDLPPDETAAIMARVQSASFVAGTHIIERGVWHGTLYIICSGHVSASE